MRSEDYNQPCISQDACQDHTKMNKDKTTTQENLLQTLYVLEAENERLHDVIDKIKAEIDEESAKSLGYPNWERAKALKWVLSIIDRYTEESEDKE